MPESRHGATGLSGVTHNQQRLMNIPNAKTLEEGIKHILFMRKWKPFEWSGKLWVVETKSGISCYRSKRSAQKNTISSDCLVIR